MILVRVNERLNIFGAFYHEKLIQRDGKCGNYQLMDHIAALDFVRYIIDDLKGDPDRISVFGQSAGGMGVQQMICSPYVNGKISSAVMQSGLSFVIAARPQVSMQIAVMASHDYLAEKGLSFEKMEHMPPEKLYALSDEYLEFLERYGAGYGAVTDGDYILENCTDTIMKGNIPDVPYMVGCCSRDGRMGAQKPEEGPFYKSLELFCRVLSAQGKKGYMYLFDRELPGDASGAFHASDLWYVFGTMKNSWRPFDDRDQKLSDEMIDAWADFFKTGKPGRTDEWSAYTEDTRFVKKWDKRDGGKA